MPENHPDSNPSPYASLSAQLEQVTALNTVLSRLVAAVLDFDIFLKEMVAATLSYVHCDRVILLLVDDQETQLRFGLSNYRLPSPERQAHLEALRLAIYNADNDTLVNSWLAGNAVMVQVDLISPLSTGGWLAQLIQSAAFFSVPFIL
ncbi:MAG TPA: hypothetical protein VHO69_13335, partial [Phototrophicaceae bacterium]|nr:hypothetical protein [Phototrophicaceae bacterium]